MLKPSPTLSRVTVAVVSSFSAVNPTAPSCPESAMVKQPACAAASNSSGLVPTPFSNRVLNEYCACFSVPLSVEIVPLPLFRSPCQTALALRCMMLLLFAVFRFFSMIGILTIRFRRSWEGYIDRRDAVETRLVHLDAQPARSDRGRVNPTTDARCVFVAAADRGGRS